MVVDRGLIHKILVIQLRAIGDVVLTTAALTILRKHFPGAQIHFLTMPPTAALLAELPELNRVIPYPYRPEQLLGIPRMIPRLRQERYDLVIDYQGTPGTAYLTRFSGARYRLGWKMKRRQWAYNLTSTANARREYVAVQKCRALREIGIDELTGRTKIAISRSDRQVVRDYFKSIGVGEADLKINITPVGKRQTRQWEAPKIAELSDWLTGELGARVFYNWAPGERQEAERRASLCRHPVQLLPQWPLTTFAAYLSQVDLHFSYDNGPKHLAIAVGTPTLSLFATDPPELWNPLADEDHPFLLADVPCRFCGLKECDSMICMRQITVEMVIDQIRRMPALRAKIDNRGGA